MVRKLIISIVFLMSGICLFAQGNFMFNQHANQDCEYGNLNEFTHVAGGFSYNFIFSNCPSIYELTSLEDCHYVLDSYRSGCTYSQGSSGSIGYTDSLAVGHYVLDGVGGVKCKLRNFGVGAFWFVSTPMGAIGNVAIMQITNGVITYIEYY